MLISTAKSVVKRMRKSRNVIITDDEPSWLTLTHVGNMS
jgi:hypothetical protein